jgi:hypothetical protein
MFANLARILSLLAVLGLACFLAPEDASAQGTTTVTTVISHPVGPGFLDAKFVAAPGPFGTWMVEVRVKPHHATIDLFGTLLVLRGNGSGSAVLPYDVPYVVPVTGLYWDGQHQNELPIVLNLGITVSSVGVVTVLQWGTFV